MGEARDRESGPGRRTAAMGQKGEREGRERRGKDGEGDRHQKENHARRYAGSMRKGVRQYGRYGMGDPEWWSEWSRVVG